MESTHLPPRGSPTAGEPVDTAGVLEAGKVAVITGAGAGIGRCTALRCAKLGMKLVLADIKGDELESVRSECVTAGASSDSVVVQVCDVSNEADVRKLKDVAFSSFNCVHLLMNNAGIQNNGKGSAIEYLDRWKAVTDVNFWGVVYGCQVFVPDMIASGEKCVVVNTGSKQGITAPPGDTAYNCTKAAVKTLTEGLQHTLRSTPGCMVNAFLLVPGWAITMIGTNANKRLQGPSWDPKAAQDERGYDGVDSRAVALEKLSARGAWPAEQVVDEFFAAVNAGAPFYIICPDNETTVEQDKGRMQWASDDLLFRRVPLSRWSDQYKDEYASVAKNFSASGGEPVPRGSLTPGAPVDSAGILEAGKVAVITGAGSGIGRCTALRCAKLGMKLVLADIKGDDLESVRSECVSAGAAPQSVITQVCDVSSEADVRRLKELAFGTFKHVNFLMNNAAIQNNGNASAIDFLDRWKAIMAVNMWGVVHGCQAFVPDMIASGEKCVVVNTGSKQGITAPPGDTAYNCSKAVVKTLTEGLQHTLRNIPGCKVNAFLLVPGWTITMIASNANKRLKGADWDPKTAQDERGYDGVQDRVVAHDKLVARGAWPADRVVDECFSAVNVGAPFYIICPDSETTADQDKGRMQWSADDIIFRRVPLSRWSHQYKEEYAKVSSNF